jgi:D-alanyl-D-alanine carboxypeptidase
VGRRSIEHSGEVSGFVSDNEVLVDDGVAVAVLTNQDAVNAASIIAQFVAPVVLDAHRDAPEQQAIDIYHGLLQGKIDRSLLAPNLSDYFTPETISDFQQSLSPLGEPLIFHQEREQFARGHDVSVVSDCVSGEAAAADYLYRRTRMGSWSSI